MEIRRWSERRGKGGATDIECCRLTGGKEGRRKWLSRSVLDTVCMVSCEFGICKIYSSTDI